MLNHVVLCGRLIRAAETRVLPSGVTVVNLEVRVEAGDGPADSVPAVWSDPPAWAATLDAGVGLVIVGRIRRRFFRAGGTTQSRTEVLVERAARAALRRQATAVLAGAATTVEAAAAESTRSGVASGAGAGRVLR